MSFCLAAADAAGRAKRRGISVDFLLDVPEDLGRQELGDPAAISQLPFVHAIALSGGVHTGAFRHSDFQSPEGATLDHKPTRLLTSMSSLLDPPMVRDMPSFGAGRNYLGPFNLA